MDVDVVCSLVWSYDIAVLPRFLGTPLCPWLEASLVFSVAPVISVCVKPGMTSNCSLAMFFEFSLCPEQWKCLLHSVFWVSSEAEVTLPWILKCDADVGRLWSQADAPGVGDCHGSRATEGTDMSLSLCFSPARTGTSIHTCWVTIFYHTKVIIPFVRNILVVWQKELPRKKNPAKNENHDVDNQERISAL